MNAMNAMNGWPAAPQAVALPEGEALPVQPSPPRIKVLHVITRFWAGAGGNTLLSALGMDPSRYEVWIAGVPGGDLWPRARAGGVHCVELPGFRAALSPTDLLVLVRLVRLIRRERFSVVHTHSAKGGFLGRLAARLCRTPVVVHTFHGLSFHPRMPWLRRTLYRRLERLPRRWTDAFLSVAPQLAREAVEERLAPPGSVGLAPSAVELDTIPADFDPAARAGLGVPTDTALIGTVGRIDEQKAPLDFVRMAAQVRAARPDTAFVMIGGGPLEDQVRSLADSLGVDIRITGYRPDAAQLVAGLDVFVVSSLYEGLGRALTEALATARPTVATCVNGVPDLIAPGATGLLAAPADPSSLSASVLWLLDHPSQSAAMGHRGRTRVRSAFAPEQMCAILDRCYRRCLCLAPPGALPPPGPATEVEAEVVQELGPGAHGGTRVARRGDGTLRAS